MLQNFSPLAVPSAPRRATRVLWRLALLGVLAGASTLAAAEDDSRLIQTRELARRAQQAAQAAQQDAAAQRSEAEKLKKELAELQRSLAELRNNSQREKQQVSAQVSAAKAEQAKIEQALQGEQTNLAQLRQQLEQQEARSRELERQLAEQQQVAASVTRLLEERSKALAQAQAANRELYSLGQQALEGRADTSAFSRFAQQVLGLGEVERASQAQLLAQRMAAQRVAAP